MRRLMFAATLIATTAGMIALATPGEAASGKVRYKYCSSSTNEGRQCMYDTYAECRAAARGTGADCIRNPRSYKRRAAY
jgi:Protein of unknown function (DUF3551)